ncbi:uncharacterized protein BT62DRAFT_935517 [Guyanagaster necrorhizus]|uniref:Uncharacterized protein n=1 Tax=Guyanagaster necrorhizus TaxID=856835 RepID=A0A9P7VM79_9AGAR|nr:uncharacterized protein BT62DRAFT_935517 [Guyanagaster necrorhizus MCA 3950]KAG7443177.1 hypothetical protein BT62DRAFT_935517 [Guyanagaster necrorhizus MCA 3950]
MQHPTDVFIDVLDGPARAHIRFVDAGVLTPGRTKQPHPVPFSIVLERLYFGFLPASDQCISGENIGRS